MFTHNPHLWRRGGAGRGWVGGGGGGGAGWWRGWGRVAVVVVVYGGEQRRALQRISFLTLGYHT